MTEPENVIRAFSADHVVRLTGLSKNQLRYWDETGFFVPDFASPDRRMPYGRVYSFRDVVGLRTIAVLRKEHRVSLQHLRKVAEKLSRYDQSLWSDLKLYVLKREVYFGPPGSKVVQNVDGQLAAVVMLNDIINDVAENARKLKERTPQQFGQVEKHRYVANNEWVVSGTRIPIRAIRDFHEAGYSMNEILQEYPSLTRRDIEAALSHKEKTAKSA